MSFPSAKRTQPFFGLRLLRDEFYFIVVSTLTLPALFVPFTVSDGEIIHALNPSAATIIKSFVIKYPLLVMPPDIREIPNAVAINWNIAWFFQV